MLNLAITTGEPAGIGPEISVRAAKKFLELHTDVSLSLIGDAHLLSGFSLPRLSIDSVPLRAPVTPGVLDAANSAYVIDTLNRATDLCLRGHYDAMVTAPVHKSIIAEAGYSFMGHTEYLAERCQVKKVVMMLCGHPQVGQDIFPKMLRVALATTHIPLAQVAATLKVEDLKAIIQIAHDDLRSKFGIAQPKIALTGLNPHAGESGKMGREEIEIIKPALDWASQQGIDAHGPYPGDTIFTPEHLRGYDLIVAMQHDQGLAPFKMLTFGQGVNVTLGLPIIRTSVDHGTALGIAGKNQADEGSMLAALELAYQLAKKHATSS